MAESESVTARGNPASSFVIGPVIAWTAVAATVRALAATAGPEGLASLEQLVMGLTDPLRRLDSLASLAQRAVDGDDRAADDLHSALASIIKLSPTARGLFARLVGDEWRKRADARCDCGDERHSVVVSGGKGEIAAANPDVLDEVGLVALVLAIARIYSSDPPQIRTEALDAIVVLLLAADTFASLARASRAGGPARLLGQLEVIGANGRLAGMSGMPVRSGFGGPGVPDFPSGWPGGGSELKLPRPKPVEEILAAIKGRKHWGPDIWEPVVQLVREPVIDFPPGWLDAQACLHEVLRRIAARTAIPPPARPVRVTWTEGITSIVVSGPCAGDTLVIHGHGFAALRQTAVLLLPFEDGCHPVPVPTASWTDTAITVTLPGGVVSGPIGFADASYVAAYAAWVAEQNRLADEIRQFRCYRLAGRIPLAGPFSECPPDIGINHIRAGAPIIKSFTANGQSLSVVVEPSTPVVLAWTVRNAEQVKVVQMTEQEGPGFAGSVFVDDPTGSSYDLGPFTGDMPEDARYELRVTGPCGVVTASVWVRLRKVPVLQIVGVEVTQAVQTFRDPNAPSNSIPLVARKDTIVRVYVAVENLGGFKSDEVDISGEMQVDGQVPPLRPLGQAKAHPSAKIDRGETDNTLNFKIPAALASGSTKLRIKVWAAHEVETPPLGIKTRPTAGPIYHAIAWIDKRPFKVRYVNIFHDSVSRPRSDQQVQDHVVGAFDLLPTPPTDILAAPQANWHTSVDIDSHEGISELLGHIDDQHDCAFSEWLFPWEEECPDDDGAVWVGVLPREGNPNGLAEASTLPWFAIPLITASSWDPTRNTVIASPNRFTIAHELGHVLGLKHVYIGSAVSLVPDPPYDVLPDNGRIQRIDTFDPRYATVVGDPNSYDLFDIMSYSEGRWVSRTNWQRMYAKF